MSFEIDDQWKSHFDMSGYSAYFDTAAEGLPLKASQDALQRYLDDKFSGTPGRAQMFTAEQETLDAAAKLLGTSAQNVAFTGNATDALNLFGNSLRWRAGDEVLITDLEFSSNILCWVRLRERGVRVEVIPSELGVIELNQFTSRLKPSTRLVSVSQVSYKTGTQFPYLRELADEVHNAGALFVVDATQAVGRVPVTVEGVDFLVSSSYKWLLGIHGLGLVYCAPHLLEELTPGAAGWYSVTNSFAADRFERVTLRDGAARFAGGMPNFASIYVMREGLRFLQQLGIERIDIRLRPIVRRLREGLAALGLQMLTPADEQYASGIVSFAHATPEELGHALMQKGIIVWAGDGRLRASIHVYNSEEEVDRLLTVLQELLVCVRD